MSKRLTAQQFELVTRARYGLGPRPTRAQVPSITRRDYGYVLDRWAAFDRWRAWKDAGGKRPKPAGVWRAVPGWDARTFTPFVLLDAIRHAHPLPASHPIVVKPAQGVTPGGLELGQSWFVIADAYRNAAVGPQYFGRAFTADHGYEHPTREEITALRARGIRTAVWGDTRPGDDGTTAAQIIEVANELRVDRPMFQAERVDECRAALDAIAQLGAPGLLIVNLDAIMQGDDKLWRELSAKITSGEVIALAESYRNCGWQRINYHGLPIASTLAATYRDAECHGCTIDEMYDEGTVAAHRDSWYTASWSPADYAAAR